MSAAATIVALPVSALVLWALLRTRAAERVVAVPSGDRWHDRSTPAFGGVGIFAGLVAGVGAALAVGALEPSAELAGLAAGATILFLLGVVDDLRSLGAVPKLAGQLAAAAVALAAGVQVEIVGSPVLAIGLGLVWIVGMTNAFNLLDNMDGLAASLAAIALAYLAIDAATVHPNDTILAICLAGALACAGFLPFNVRAGGARLFMGDSGSQVLGFTLAGVALLASWQQAGTTVATLLLPILVLAVPIVDTALVVVVRLLEGRPIYQGGRDHSSHRLVYYGLTERRALVLLALIAAGLGASSLGYTVLDNAQLTLVGVLVTFALLVQFASFLADIERGPVAVAPGRRGLLGGLIVHRRRLVEVLVDFALIAAAFLTAYQLRVWDTGSPWDPYVVETVLPVLLVCRFLAFIPLGLYRGVWRYAGSRDAVAVVVAVLLSEAVAVGVLAATADRWADIPRAVFVVDALFCIALVGAARFGERALARTLVRFRGRSALERTLVVGAGRAGRSLVRELREAAGGANVVGFVDDDARLRGRRLLGVPVLGDTSELATVLTGARAQRVLVTIPDAPRARLDAVVGACAEAEVPCRFVRRELDLDPRHVLGAAE